MAKKEPQETPVEEQQADSSSSKKRKSALTEIEVDLSLPEPPSKKARRLLKKGKALPVKPASDDEAEDDDDKNEKEGKATDKDGKKKKKERSPYGVWIGNLRFSVTKSDLRKWLVENSGGTITDDLITRVNMPMTKPAPGPGPKKTPENRGFAYVDFATFEANVAAIALSETEWHGRKLLIKDATNFEGRPKKEELPAVEADGTIKGKAVETPVTGGSTKIFVGNLSFNTTEDDLHAQFEKCGKIRWVKVATFEDSGKCKGYGWVNFEEPEAAAWAVKGFVKVRETVETLEDFMDVDKKEEEKEETNGAEAAEDKKDGSDSSSSDDSASDSDSGSDSSSSSSSSSEDEKTKSKKKEKKAQPAKPTPAKPTTTTTTQKEPPRVRTRKWWVNQLLGRTLKIELAEDDQTRYNKRFRNGGAAKNNQQQQQQQQRGPRQGGAGGRPNRQDYNGNTGGGGATETNGTATGREGDDNKKEKKAVQNYHTDIAVARLTGAAVAPQGKKVTFD